MPASVTPLPLHAAPAPPRTAEIARDRLTHRLLGAREPVVVLRAPAGYGKSMLLAAWARDDRRAFTWLLPGRTVTGVRNRVFVIDGWSAAALGDPAALAGRLGPGSQLVIVSRAAIPLGRLRAQHDVLELGSTDLAMTHGEAALLLDAAGAAVGGAPLDALLRTTEGWPALLSLAALRLAAAPDRAGTARCFGATEPFVVDYVLGEALARFPAPVVTFLRRVALLDVLEAESCDELLGGREAAALIDAAIRVGLPTTRAAPGAAGLRVHPLVAQILRDELRRREPRIEQRLRRRASRLLEARGDLEEAIAHAVAGHDVERAGELLWRRGATYAWDGRATELGRWLDALPPGAAERHASIALTVAMHAAPCLALGRADRALAAADRALDDAPAGLVPTLRAGRAALDAFTAGDGGAGTLLAASRVARTAADGEPARALACLLEGAGHLLAGDAACAVAPLEDGVRRAFVAAPAIAALCEAELALIALCEGEADEGIRRAERARARVTAHCLDDYAALALVVAVAALARTVAGRYEQARVDAAAAAALLAGRDAVPLWLQAQVELALGRALLRLSDVAGARARLAAARRLAARMPDARGLAAWIAAAEVTLVALAQTADRAPCDVLTPAELRVLRHLPSHRSCREIGTSELVSANTIKSQVHAIYRKLGVSSRSAAVGRAAELGLIDDASCASTTTVRAIRS